MKIKTDYVTNSSSTSYIIISDDFSKDVLGDLMGIGAESPLSVLVDSLYESIMRTRGPAHLAREVEHDHGGDFEAFISREFSDRVLPKVIEAQRTGKRVWFGHLSSEETRGETLFCCDSFEWEDEKLYINALRCVW